MKPLLASIAATVSLLCLSAPSVVAETAAPADEPGVVKLPYMPVWVRKVSDEEMAKLCTGPGQVIYGDTLVVRSDIPIKDERTLRVGDILKDIGNKWKVPFSDIVATAEYEIRTGDYSYQREPTFGGTAYRTGARCAQMNVNFPVTPPPRKKL